MKKMIALTLLALCLVIFSLPVDCKAQKHTIVTEIIFPASHPRLGQNTVMGEWLNAVESESKGLITIERHWGGEPVPVKEALDALGAGTIDMLVTFPSWYSGKIAIGDIVAIAKNFKTVADFYDLWWYSPLGKIMDEVYQKRANAKAIFGGPLAASSFQISKRAKKIRHIDDFKGLKIRAAGGTASQIVKYLGGSPVFLIAAEYYTGMQRGSIDAGLMATHSLQSYKMWEVSDQVVTTAPINNNFGFVFMNYDKWNKLDAKLQGLLVDNARKLESHAIAAVNLVDARITKMAREKGVEFYALPPEDEAKMWELVEPIWDSYVDSCSKQGLGEEGKQVREIIGKRFSAQ